MCDELEKAKAMEMFQNRHVHIRSEGCTLPDISSFFRSAPWQLERMRSAREALNYSKDSLDNYDRR